MTYRTVQSHLRCCQFPSTSAFSCTKRRRSVTSGFPLRCRFRAHTSPPALLDITNFFPPSLVPGPPQHRIPAITTAAVVVVAQLNSASVFVSTSPLFTSKCRSSAPRSSAPAPRASSPPPRGPRLLPSMLPRSALLCLLARR